MNIVFLDRKTLAGDIRLGFEQLPAVQYREYPMTSPQQVLVHARDAEVLVTNKVKLPAAILQALPRLRLVAVAATGVDHVDLDAARAANIAVTHVRDYASHSVAEHVFGMLLALQRNLLRYAHATRSGAWSRADTFCLQTYPINDLAGGTLGVIGGGTLGQAVLRLGEAFGMRGLLAERRAATSVRPGRVAWHAVLEQSDVISLHVPLTEGTRGLIGADEIARMPSHAVLVNTSRGEVVDEAALLAALYCGGLGGACLDVLAQEPPTLDHPLLCAGLPNLIITPHVAWASRQAQQTLADEVARNIAAFLRGESRNRVV
jgi:glycerate dehydrogenase